jgi:hypothetical protein
LGHGAADRRLNRGGAVPCWYYDGYARLHLMSIA